MHNVCTIVLCLIESACMQIRAEEQDDDDKMDIALMGRKDKPDATSISMQSEAKTMASFLPKTDFPEPVGASN